MEKKSLEQLLKEKYARLGREPRRLWQDPTTEPNPKSKAAKNSPQKKKLDSKNKTTRKPAKKK